MNLMPFLVFPLVGAGIGALTNHLAIRMLFRPFRPWTLAGCRVPFTPGVIPRRRAELAASIARAFERHLISGRHLHELITGARMLALLEAKVDTLIASFGFVAGMLKGAKPAIMRHLAEALEEVAAKALETGGPLDVGRLLEDRINQLDLRELESLILQVTRTQLRHITVFGAILGAAIGLVQALLALAL